MKATSITYSVPYSDKSDHEYLVRFSTLSYDSGEVIIIIGYQGSEIHIPEKEIHWFIEAIEDGLLKIKKEAK